MAQAGLLFSALDFVITPNDEWVFLESNASGQYAWIEDATGHRITDALADLLAQGSER